MTWKDKVDNALEHMTAILYTNKHMRCSMLHFDEDYLKQFKCPELIRDSKGCKLFPGNDYVVVTCENEYKYYINVSGDSIVTMCSEVFDFIQYR